MYRLQRRATSRASSSLERSLTVDFLSDLSIVPMGRSTCITAAHGIPDLSELEPRYGSVSDASWQRIGKPASPQCPFSEIRYWPADVAVARPSQ